MNSMTSLPLAALLNVSNRTVRAATWCSHTHNHFLVTVGGKIVGKKSYIEPYTQTDVQI